MPFLERESWSYAFSVQPKAGVCCSTPNGMSAVWGLIPDALHPIKGTVNCSAQKGPVTQIAGAEGNHADCSLYCFAVWITNTVGSDLSCCLCYCAAVGWPTLMGWFQFTCSLIHPAAIQNVKPVVISLICSFYTCADIKQLVMLALNHWNQRGTILQLSHCNVDCNIWSFCRHWKINPAGFLLGLIWTVCTILLKINPACFYLDFGLLHTGGFWISMLLELIAFVCTALQTLENQLSRGWLHPFVLLYSRWKLDLNYSWSHSVGIGK